MGVRGSGPNCVHTFNDKVASRRDVPARLLKALQFA